MTVRVYSFFDSGAPTFDSDPGGVFAVLDAVLVNGYGSKPAAGWTKEFTAANVAVYRAPALSGSPSEGLRHYIRVAHTGGTTLHARAYETMSDANTGTNPYPTVAQATNGVGWGMTSSSGATRGWVMVANDKFFYIIFFPALNIGAYNSVDGWRSFYTKIYGFGEFPSRYGGDMYNSLIFGSDTNSSTYTLDPSIGSFFASATIPADGQATGSSIGCYVARSYDGSIISYSAHKKPLLTSRSHSGTYPTFESPFYAEDSFNTCFFRKEVYVTLSRIALIEGTGVANTLSFRGYFPGAYTSPQSIALLGSPFVPFRIANPISGAFYTNERQFIAVPFSTAEDTSASAILIDLDEERW